MATIQKEQLRYINFLGVSLQYALINGVFWLNATEILNAILDVSTVQTNKLKDGEHATLDGASAVQVFVPFSILSLTVQRLMFSKATKTDYFNEIMESGGIEKLNQMLHYSNSMIFHTIETLLVDLDDAKKHNVLIQDFLNDKNNEYDKLFADYQKVENDLSLSEGQLEKINVERDELQQQFTQQSKVLNNCVSNISELDQTILAKNAKIEKIVADHETEKTQLQKENDEKAAKVAENHANELQQLKDDHQEVLRPLLERSKLRKFWLDRDASLYAQIALQIVCMAFMFPLIHKHYPFTNYPTWLGIVFDTMLTAMLPIASILFSLRKRNDWLWGIFGFEVLFSNSQTELFNPYLGENIHFVENLAVTFFLPLLLVAFGTLTAKRETNKALLETPKE